MSDLESVDLMFGSYSRNDDQNDSDNDLDSGYSEFLPLFQVSSSHK